MSTKMITDQDILDSWEKIGDEFDDYWPLFSTFWKIGRPIFTDKIPTAAVSFDPQSGGEFLDFYFNPKFYRRLSNYERAFIIAHESLHVFLNHGVRSKDLPKEEGQIANFAMDVVVNHMLTDYFGFDRSKIKMADQLCWLDTVFKEHPRKSAHADKITKQIGGKINPWKNVTVLKGQNFEYYFSLLMQHANIVVFDGIGTLDDHSFFEGKDANHVIGKIMGDAEKNPDAKDAADDVNSQAGTGSGGWVKFKQQYVREKKTWESIFKKMFRDWSEKPQEQWARMPRRFSNLPDDIILPSEMEDEEKKKELIKIWLFLDTSGSCWGMKDRFIKAYNTIPKHLFEVKVHSFDTGVREIDLKHGRLYGGGGTSFECIEQYIRGEIHRKSIPYPQCIVVFTDGEGDEVHPKHSNRWYWFLQAKLDPKSLIPKDSLVYYLQDFE